MRKRLSLLVFPNPYRHLDADGEACCVVTRADFRAMLIGAQLDQERTTHVGEEKRTKSKFLFDLAEPVEIPAVPAHLNALLDGALLPANEATARAAGRPFLPLAAALAAAKEAARAEWLAATGEEIEPALFATGPLPAAPTPTAADLALIASLDAPAAPLPALPPAAEPAAPSTSPTADPIATKAKS